MSSNKRQKIAGLLYVTGLPFILGCMVTVAIVALGLGAKVLLDREGEWGLPTVVAEYFWIGVWVALAAFVILAVGLVFLSLLARRIAHPIGRLAEAADRAATSAAGVRLDEHQRLYELHRLAVSFNRLVLERERVTDEIRSLSRSVLHDLRSSLGKICEKADQLEHDLVEREEAAATIRKISRSLVNLVEANAEISRNYAGDESVPAQDVDLVDIARDAGDTYEAGAEMKGLGWTISLPEKPIVFRGHAFKLRQLVGNLLDNAVKYTPPGGHVSLSLSLDGKSVVLVVSDTGCGISASDQVTMYERFFRCAASRAIPGTGLGLSQVHSIVTFYNGRIDCDSALGKGTTFTVTLAPVLN